MHKLAALCVRRPVFATMLVLSLTVIGTFAYFTLGVDLIPKVDVPTVVVTILNPGATAEEIETEITKRVEDSVNTISEIDEVLGDASGVTGEAAASAASRSFTSAVSSWRRPSVFMMFQICTCAA